MFHSITINARPIDESMIRFIEDCMFSTKIKLWTMKTSSSTDFDEDRFAKETHMVEAKATLNCGDSMLDELYDKIYDRYGDETSRLMTFK